MCWKSFTLVKKHVAEKDIKVIKIVTVDSLEIYSYFYNFPYKFNKLYFTKIGFSFNLLTTFIDEGFHSYSKNVKIKESLGKYTIFDKNKRKLGEYKKGVVVECIIPKGSTYFINKFEEIVSDQIIIKNVLE